MEMSKIVIVIVICQIICVANADVSRNIIKDKGFTYIGSFKSSENTTQLGQRFNENDYYVSINVGAWISAVADCTNIFGPYGGLIAIDTVEEWDFLKILLENYGFGTTYWTSGTFDLLTSGWVWSTNNQPIFQPPPWGSGFPPQTPNIILRIQIYHTNRFDAAWRTIADTQLHRYICEVRKSN